ncbi:E3 ISG15--protein ligase Herc6 [Parasteatoda tepidariorum]|uniref:E3 ISG15--protein ligase Herc6 n=1 Tax=Parasteatoda tepidariorum TaxID=114398 RepID=UPI00077FC398|nr:probable E3 ubiquitin-protein ligase HERC4 [Parasteatoda tepidariorum]
MSLNTDWKSHKTKRSFIFYGNNLFKKLDCFKIELSEINIKYKTLKQFSSLDLTPYSIIKGIFIGWSFLLIKINEGTYHCGFYETANEESHPRKIFSGVHDLSCSLSDSYIISETLDLYHVSHPDFVVNKIDIQDKKLDRIATEDLYTIALTTEGKVLDIKKTEEIQVTLIDLPFIINQVACGKEHVLLLSSSGVVLSYGFGSRGQLGHNNLHKLEKPVILEALEGIEIIAIAAGGWHSAAISSIGDLYMWGWNESGQLGLPCPKLEGNRSSSEIYTACYLPKLIDLDDKKVTKISCGSRHTAAITEDKQLWTWGYNNWGQLGNKNCLFNDTPEKVSLPKNFIVQNVKCKFWDTLIEGCIEK